MSQQQHDAASALPSLCASGCGFYSNVGTGGLCSKCFRDQQLQAGKALEAQQKAAPLATQAASVLAASSHQASSAAEALPSTSASVEPAAPAEPAAAPAEAPSASAVDLPPAKPVSATRCFVCAKKVGLTGFSCKCQPEPAVFCSTHRYAEAHDCKFDFKSAQRAALAANNPAVQASKVQKL